MSGVGAWVDGDLTLAQFFDRFPHDQSVSIARVF